MEVEERTAKAVLSELHILAALNEHKSESSHVIELVQAYCAPHVAVASDLKEVSVT